MASYQTKTLVYGESISLAVFVEQKSSGLNWLDASVCLSAVSVRKNFAVNADERCRK